MNRMLWVPIASLAFFAGCSSTPAGLPETITLDSGQIKGVAAKEGDAVRIFKGIPYAAAPTGDLRWKPPQAVAKWDGVKAADQFGHSCMQANNPAEGLSEDCLFLNIWTPAKSADAKLPVMLWIYGGGYNTGSGAQAMYDGEELAKKGAVIVTINYRLGAFGFFSHPELTAESNGQAAGNFGMMDAIAALEWTKRNIAAFGGDPTRVTIFGESAGAGLIAGLQASPKAAGLFHRVIGESSSWTTASIGRMTKLAEAEKAGTALAEKAGAKSLAELRAKSAAEILAAGRGPGPIVDGVWLTDDPGNIFAQGKQTDVPALVGSNRDESFGGVPKDRADHMKRAKDRYGDLAAKYLEVYPGATDEEAQDNGWRSGRDEVAFVMRNWARLASTTGKSKAFLYFFTHQPPATPNAKGPFAPTKHGTATHVSEILYVFNHLQGNRPFTDADRKIADLMSSYWVNFATNGDPNGPGLATWPVFDATAENNAMLFGEDAATPGSSIGMKEAAFLQSYYDRLYEK